MRNILPFFVFIAAWLSSSPVAAEECWTATLQVAVEESSQREGRKKSEVSRESFRVQGEGEVRFLAGGGKTGIVYKSLHGSWEGAMFRETSCVVHEGKISGLLTEGVTRNEKIHTAFWSMRMEGQATVKAVKGCRQETLPGVSGTEERADPRFHDIVHPNLGKLVSLCKKVRAFPMLGECRTTVDEISGHLTLTETSPATGEPAGLNWGSQDYRYRTRYSWSARRVPCACTATVIHVVGEAKLNGRPLEKGVEFNLSGATIEAVGRSQAVIETPDHVQIRVKPRTKIDLSDLCREIEVDRDQSPRLIRNLSGALYLILKKIVGEDNRGRLGISARGGGIRGGLNREKTLLAAVGLQPGMVPAPVFQAEAETAEERSDVDEAAARQAPAAVFCRYRPEEGDLLFEVLRGTLTVRESAGGMFLLREGEVFRRRWSPEIDPARMPTIEAWLQP